MVRGREDDRLAVIQRREDVLDLIADNPLRQAEIADNLGISRSTVTRAMSELQDHDLVERIEGQYRVTSLGRTALESHRRYTALIRRLFECEPFLEHVPADAPFDPFLLADSTCHLVEQGASFQIRERVNQEFRNADRIVGLGRTRSTQAAADIFYQKVVVEGLPAENVLSTDLYTHLTELEKGREILTAENMETAIHDDVPYGLFLLGQGNGRTMVMTVYDETDSMKGVITSQSKFAIAWAETVYESYRSEAVPKAEYEG